MSPPPAFPPPFVIERTRSLGFGTGPWKREQFVEAWGAPMADKYIGEAKANGWLVSPYRGTYFVPAAQDLTVVSWLPEPARSEFLISRTLAAANLPAWCLSAWCRDRGLLLGAPTFVTDLGAAAGPPAARSRPGWQSLQEDARTAARKQPSLPFLESLVIVPAMPEEAAPDPLVALVPETRETESRRQTQELVGTAAVGLIGLAVWAVTKELPQMAEPMRDVRALQARQRGIPYSLGPAVKDDAWIVALLASLGTPRIEELVDRFRRTNPGLKSSAIQKWAGLFGPPQPNNLWKDTILGGTFPFLMVPPSLCAEMGADQAARRFRTLQRLGSG